MDYRSLFIEIVSHFETTEEYSRYVTLGLDIVDIYLDPSYPGYFDGILALKGVSINPSVYSYSQYDVYANIKLTCNSILSFTLSQCKDVNHVYIIDYDCYNSTDFCVLHEKYECLGEAPNGLKLHYSESLIDFSLLENLDKQNITLLVSYLYYIRVNIDTSSDISYIAKLFYNLCLHYIEQVSRSMTLLVTFSGDDPYKLYIRLFSEFYSVYKNYSSADKKTLSAMFKICKVEFNFYLLREDGSSDLYYVPEGFFQNKLPLDYILNSKGLVKDGK